MLKVVSCVLVPVHSTNKAVFTDITSSLAHEQLFSRQAARSNINLFNIKSQNHIRLALRDLSTKAASRRSTIVYNVDRKNDNEDDEDEDFDEDIEIFNFETGWNVDDYDGLDDMEEEEAAAEFVAGLRIPQRLRRQLQREERERALEEQTSDVPAKRSTHKKLRIISGTSASRRLLSPADANVRPMMEKVRGALFSMLQSYCSSGPGLPVESRWLDLYSGTGSVALEGLSRGCKEAHFVEADSWVVANVLGKNIETCDAAQKSTVHTQYVEKFLQNTAERPQSFGGAFDFISVTPPYEKVSYQEIMSLLNESPLLHANTFVIVEYPRKATSCIPEELGPLVKIRDRKYGRTLVAIYGPLNEIE